MHNIVAAENQKIHFSWWNALMIGCSIQMPDYNWLKNLLFSQNQPQSTPRNQLFNFHQLHDQLYTTYVQVFIVLLDFLENFQSLYRLKWTIDKFYMYEWNFAYASNVDFFLYWLIWRLMRQFTNNTTCSLTSLYKSWMTVLWVYKISCIVIHHV